MDPDCSDSTASVHPGICNSPRNIELSGQGPRGSALVNNSTAIGLLNDNGSCTTSMPRNPDGSCRFRDYGPDCLPCTSDDVDMGTQENLPTTTGTAEGAVYDASNVPSNDPNFPNYIDEGSGEACTSDDQCRRHETCRRTCERSGFECSSDAQCDTPQNPNDTCRSQRCEVFCELGKRCLIGRTGTPFDCDLLLQEPTDGLAGAGLAVTFPDIDARQVGDNVTASILGLE
jgi:hypothetical protein